MPVISEDDFRPIVASNRNNAVGDAPADQYVGGLFGIKGRIILRKQDMIGDCQAADTGQTELTAVGMTAEYKVNTTCRLSVK